VPMRCAVQCDVPALLHWPLAAHVGHVGFVSVQSAVVERPVGQAMPLHSCRNSPSVRPARVRSQLCTRASTMRV
jgi:hypothetical protein